MAKPSLGVKRICANCHQPFYDLNKNPAHCPNCDQTFDPGEILRGRRGRGNEDVKKIDEPKLAKAPETGDAAEVAEGEEGEEAEEELLEDASDLGEDEDDMSEVIENVNEGGGGEER